jgi:hypothetical protein
VVSRSPCRGHECALGGRLLLLVEHRRLDRADLAVEPALGPRLLGPALRLEAPLVDVLAGDAAALGDPLGRGELVGRSMSHDEGRSTERSGPALAPSPIDAHRLDAARDADVDRTGGDEPGDQVIGLLPAAALAVDGGGADMLGQSGDQPRDPADVVGLWANW